MSITLSKMKKISLYYRQHRGQTSIDMIKHYFCENLAKVANFEKDEKEILNGKFLTGNTSCLTPLKEAENRSSTSCLVCATQQSQ